MDFNKKQPKLTPEDLIDTITWGGGTGILLPGGSREPDLDYFVIDEDGKTVKCLSRTGVLMHFGDLKSTRAQGQTPKAPHHVCTSATCVHDYMSSPGTNQQQTSTVMPLWKAPISRTARTA